MSSKSNRIGRMVQPTEAERYKYYQDHQDGPFIKGRTFKRINLYKYVSWEALEKIIENGDLKISTMREVNDPFESLPADLDRVPEFFDGFGFISLTKTPHNAAMWGHYADSHKGVCLQFSFSVTDIKAQYKNHKTAFVGFSQKGAERLEGNMVKINYSRERFKGYALDFINKMKGDLLGITTAVMTRKDTSWQFENEYRIIVHLPTATRTTDEMHFTNYISNNLESVILGVRCEHSVEEATSLMQSWNSVKKPNIIQASINSDYFLVDVPGIKENSPEEKIVESGRRE
ncbi:MAG: DUF2971 domain-containing protein [Akkermansia sp.]